MTAPTDKPSRPEAVEHIDACCCGECEIRKRTKYYEIEEADAYMDWSDAERERLQQRVAELEAGREGFARECIDAYEEPKNPPQYWEPDDQDSDVLLADWIERLGQAKDRAIAAVRDREKGEK